MIKYFDKNAPRKDSFWWKGEGTRTDCKEIEIKAGDKIKNLDEDSPFKYFQVIEEFIDSKILLSIIDHNGNVGECVFGKEGNLLIEGTVDIQSRRA